MKQTMRDKMPRAQLIGADGVIVHFASVCMVIQQSTGASIIVLFRFLFFFFLLFAVVFIAEVTS